jgi:hypothetical protein
MAVALVGSNHSARPPAYLAFLMATIFCTSAITSARPGLMSMIDKVALHAGAWIEAR